MSRCVYAYMSRCVYVYMSRCVYVYMSRCVMPICLDVYVYMSRCVYVYISLCISYMYVYMSVYIWETGISAKFSSHLLIALINFYMLCISSRNIYLPMSSIL